MLDDCLLFSGSSHKDLAEQIAKKLGLKLGKVLISTFPDGEIGIEVCENVRGRDAFALQTIARRPNHYLMELLILIDALKRASARSITFIIPYYGYGRQDRKGAGRVPITAKLVADLLQRAGADRGLVMDLHAEQIQGFFDIPVDNLHARPALASAVRELGWDDCTVVAPDLGSIKLARVFADALGSDFAIVDKRRVDAKHVEAGSVIGSVQGRAVLLVDDMISTGETLKIAAQACLKDKAGPIFAIATHGLMAESAFLGSAIEKILVTNTLPLSPNLVKDSRVVEVSVAPLFSRAIELIHSSGSISSLQ